MTAVVTQLGTYDPERSPGVAPDNTAERSRDFLPDNNKVRLDFVENIGGVEVYHVTAEDPYFAEMRRVNPYAYEYAMAEMAELEEQFAALEAMLEADQSPETIALAQKLMYGPEGSTMRAWKALHPTARALEPLQLPGQPSLPTGEFIDNAAYIRFAYSPDARGIRKRGVVTEAVLVDHARRHPKKQLVWWNLGAGAAIPAAKSLNEIHTVLPEKEVSVTAVDMDASILEYARVKAEQFGLTEDDIKMVVAHLIRDFIVPDADGGNRLVKKLGENPDMIDLLGVFEYFDKKTAARLLHEAYKVLAENGVVVFGNMLKSHPNLKVNRYAVDWPGIKPRSLEEIIEIVDEAELGEDVKPRIIVSDDGVYAVVVLEKPGAPESTNVVPLNGHRRRRFGRFGLNLFGHRHNGNGHGQLEEAA